jgi:nitroreductase
VHNGKIEREATVAVEQSGDIVFHTIQTVLAVRSYRDELIPEEAVRRIVEAGRLTASAQNRQPWHFIVIQEKEVLRQLGAWSSYGPYIAEAGAAIVVAVKPSRMSSVDAARAIQSMVLQAWSEGIGSNWVGTVGLEPAKALLGVPDEIDLFAVIPLGYPAKAVGKGIKDRKPLNEIAHRERWDEAFT